MTIGNKIKLSACDKIRNIRQRKGISQEEMASRMEILQSTYNKMECGRTKLKFDDALLICEILSIAIYEIIPDGAEPLIAGERDSQVEDLLFFLQREIDYLVKVKNNIVKL